MARQTHLDQWAADTRRQRILPTRLSYRGAGERHRFTKTKTEGAAGWWCLLWQRWDKRCPVGRLDKFGPQRLALFAAGHHSPSENEIQPKSPWVRRQPGMPSAAPVPPMRSPCPSCQKPSSLRQAGGQIAMYPACRTPNPTRFLTTGTTDRIAQVGDFASACPGRNWSAFTLLSFACGDTLEGHNAELGCKKHHPLAGKRGEGARCLCRASNRKEIKQRRKQQRQLRGRRRRAGARRGELARTRGLQGAYG